MGCKSWADGWSRERHSAQLPRFLRAGTWSQSPFYSRISFTKGPWSGSLYAQTSNRGCPVLISLGRTWLVSRWQRGFPALGTEKKYLGEVARTRLGFMPHIRRGCPRSERHRAQKMEGGSEFAALRDGNTAYVEGGQGGMLTADSSQCLPGPPGPPPSTASHTQESAQGASRLSWLPGQLSHCQSSGWASKYLWVQGWRRGYRTKVPHTALQAVGRLNGAQASSQDGMVVNYLLLNNAGSWTAKVGGEGNKSAK